MSSPQTHEMMNRYWIPNLDLHKKVIIAEIRYYLGPEASVRAYTNDGEDGFLITTPGPCLSDEQIDDICNKSQQMYRRQAEARWSALNGTGMDETLKRPMHMPILITRGSGGGGGGSGGAVRHRRRRRDDLGRGRR